METVMEVEKVHCWSNNVAWVQSIGEWAESLRTAANSIVARSEGYSGAGHHSEIDGGPTITILPKIQILKI